MFLGCDVATVVVRRSDFPIGRDSRYQSREMEEARRDLVLSFLDGILPRRRKALAQNRRDMAAFYSDIEHEWKSDILKSRGGSF